MYVVMEMGDTDLSRLLKSMSQEKQIPLMMVLYYWTEMLTAVKHIHDNGKHNAFNCALVSFILREMSVQESYIRT